MLDPRHHVAMKLPQISGVWPREFSLDDSAPSVCIGLCPNLNFAEGEYFEIPDERPVVRAEPNEPDENGCANLVSLLVEDLGLTRRSSNDTTRAIVNEDGICDRIY